MRPYAALLLAFGATAACGSPSLPALARPPAESRVEHGSLVFIGDRVERVMESAADASGRTLVVVDSDRNLLVLRDGAVRASFARNELLARGRCARRPDPFLGYVSIGVSEDGREAWLVAIDGSKRPPIRTLSAACLVDLATGGTRPIDEALGPSAFFDAAHVELHGIPALALSQERAVVFGTTDTIDIGIRGTRSMTAFDIGLHDGACDVVVRGTDVVVACVVLRAGGVVRVLRLDTEGPTVRVVANELVPTGLDHPEISVSGDGRFVVAWERFGPRDNATRLAILDARSPRLLASRNVVPRALAVGIVPEGSTILVATDGGPLQAFASTGEDRATYDAAPLRGAPRLVRPMLGGQRAWFVGYDAVGLYELRSAVMSALSTTPSTPSTPSSLR